MTKSEENMTTVEVFAMGVADALYAASYHKMLKRPKAWQETQGEGERTMSDYRFGVGLHPADSFLTKHETWEEASIAAESTRPSPVRIWDFSTDTPTDVTHADPGAKPGAKPEMVSMHVRWTDEDGFESWKTCESCSRMSVDWDKDGNITLAYFRKDFPVGYTPTIHDLNEALNPYSIQVPVSEEPQWHTWVRVRGEWSASIPHSDGVSPSAVLDEDCVIVWGTSTDRDEKRDALLEAARKAGKKP